MSAQLRTSNRRIAASTSGIPRMAIQTILPGIHRVRQHPTLELRNYEGVIGTPNDVPEIAYVLAEPFSKVTAITVHKKSSRIIVAFDNGLVRIINSRLKTNNPYDLENNRYAPFDPIAEIQLPSQFEPIQFWQMTGPFLFCFAAKEVIAINVDNIRQTGPNDYINGFFAYYECFNTLRGVFEFYSRNYFIDKDGALYRMQLTHTRLNEIPFSLEPLALKIGPIDSVTPLKHIGHKFPTTSEFLFITSGKHAAVIKLNPSAVSEIKSIVCWTEGPITKREGVVHIKLYGDSIFYNISCKRKSVNCKIYQKYICNFNVKPKPNVLPNPSGLYKATERISSFIVQNSSVACLTTIGVVEVFDVKSRIKYFTSERFSKICALQMIDCNLLFATELNNLVCRNMDKERTETEGVNPFYSE